MKRTVFESEHDLFRSSVEQFFDREVIPFHEEWSAAGKVDKEMFRRAGRAGLLGMSLPEEFGGGGVDDFRFNAVIDEVVSGSSASASGMCITLHNDVCIPYFLSSSSQQQRERWMPGLVNGDLMTAIAMTEPGTGSDLSAIATSARQEGEVYVLNGSKTFSGVDSGHIWPESTPETQVPPSSVEEHAADDCGSQEERERRCYELDPGWKPVNAAHACGCGALMKRMHSG